MFVNPTLRSFTGVSSAKSEMSCVTWQIWLLRNSQIDHTYIKSLSFNPLRTPIPFHIPRWECNAECSDMERIRSELEEKLAECAL